MKSLLARQQQRNMPYEVALAYALRKDPDQMFVWLQRAWERRDPTINRLLVEPVLAPYRKDPRFRELCASMRLPVPECGAQTSSTPPDRLRF